MAYGRGEYGTVPYGGVQIVTVTKSVEFTLVEQGKLQVAVQKQAGGSVAPYPDVDVSIAAVDGDVSDAGTTDENGEVVFEGLDSSAAYQLSTAAPDPGIDDETKTVDFTTA